MGNGSTIPCAVRVSASALGVPRAAKVVMYLYGLSGGIQADIGPRRRLDQGFAEEKSGDQPFCCIKGQPAGTKWNAFIDAGCASHMKKALSLNEGLPGHHCTSSST